jgi:hypothetical protein
MGRNQVAYIFVSSRTDEIFNNPKFISMKKKILLPAMLFTALLTGAFYLSSCKKKSNDNIGFPQRITEWSDFRNDTLVSKSEYKYSGNLISEIIKYSGTMIEYSKSTFQYNGSLISSITDSTLFKGNWVKTSFIEVVSYSANNPAEFIHHDYSLNGNEEDKYKYTYSYDGSLLKEETYYIFESGTWDTNSRTNYSYDNKGRIIEERDIISSNPNLENRTIYIYDGDIMKEAIDSSFYTGIGVLYSKTTYEYENNRLTKSNYFTWGNNEWLDAGNQTCEYNEQGNVNRWQWNYGGGQLIGKSEFSYGPGIGNVRQAAQLIQEFVMIPGYPFPYPVKSKPPRHGEDQLGSSKFKL